MMRSLIVEDDPTSAIIMKDILATYGHCDMAVNGKEAVATFSHALEQGEPYDLICMDIMMPELSGQKALRLIRETEEKAGIAPGDNVKVFMTTALSATKEVADALYKGGAAAFFVKPIDVDHFINELKSVGLVE
jgi:two-component system chemotaxis response regulator CheY